MIKIADFKIFLLNNFDSRQIYFQEFKPELEFAEIDCFPSEPFKLAIEISIDSIKISTISKEPVLDFSLYDHVFESNKDAETFIFEIKRNGYSAFK